MLSLVQLELPLRFTAMLLVNDGFMPSLVKAGSDGRADESTARARSNLWR